MKHILIIEDDQVVANVYRNKLAVEGYKVEVAQDGESGLRVMRTFKPQLILLDLMLPTISGVDVIREIRSEEDFARTPIIVFSNTYLTNLIQEAWRAGANKCLSKSSCTPKDVIEVVRHTIGDSGAMPQKNAPPAPANAKTAAPAAPAANLPPAGPVATEDEDILETSPADLKQNFLSGLPVTLGSLRTGMQALIKADSEMLKLKQIYELYRVVHTLNGNASVAGMTLIAHMSAALEALLKEIYEKPKNINSSTTRTIAGAIDFLGLLFEKGVHPDQQDLPASRILVVDDEA
ncbi:MAG TPA: response regulator, partial [Verrucomicrobiae bacterium]